MPAREFLLNKNLSSLAPLLEAELTVLGDVPAAYALKFMTPSNLLRIISMLGYDASGLTGHGKDGTFADNIYVFPGNAGFAELLRCCCTCAGSRTLREFCSHARPPARRCCMLGMRCC